jgi:adenosylcobinamide-GDP ribazoletransferase
MNDETPPENTPNHWGPFWPFGEALRFLTILPIPGLPPMSEASIARAIPFFPAAGTVIGAVLVAVGWLSGLAFNDSIRAALIVVAWGIITAGLHLDGVSDTFDAVMSWRPRERKLEIMKDSRIGAMGAMALVAVMGLKVAFLASVGSDWWAAVLVAPVVGRWADIYGIFIFPAAREGGLGRSFREQVTMRDLLVATALAAGLIGVLGGLSGLVAMLFAWGTAHLLGSWWTRDLGGLTGDTYGALCEIAEVVALAVFVAQLGLRV